MFKNFFMSATILLWWPAGGSSGSCVNKPLLEAPPHHIQFLISDLLSFFFKKIIQPLIMWNATNRMSYHIEAWKDRPILCQRVVMEYNLSQKKILNWGWPPSVIYQLKKTTLNKSKSKFCWEILWCLCYKLCGQSCLCFGWNWDKVLSLASFIYHFHWTKV